MNQELEEFIRTHIPASQRERYISDLQQRVEAKEEALARGETVELEHDEALYFDLAAFQEGELESSDYGLQDPEQVLGEN